MNVSIFTYSNPYEIDQEEYYDLIKDLPQFCVSQTMVNGFRSVYGKKLKDGQLSTVEHLLDSLYPDWLGTRCSVRQFAALDNIIRYGNITEDLSSEQDFNVRRAFLNNRQEVYESIRTLIELGVTYGDIDQTKLTAEQKVLTKILAVTQSPEYIADFTLPTDFNYNEIDNAIIDAMTLGPLGNHDRDISGLDLLSIVIHGVHQFSPLMLRAIETLSQYKQVILLFNYQRQYSRIYQTWMDVYAAFNETIHTYPRNEFRPTVANADSYEGNMLGDQIGQIVEGNFSAVKPLDGYEILEFDNITEFADYVAGKFEKAAISATDAATRKPDVRHEPMDYLKEQFYSADMRVNDILRIYFPEQFGERQFLNYPIGHFFVSITNMWDVETGDIKVTDLNDIRECLSAGVIPEGTKGELASIYDSVVPLISRCTTLKGIIRVLKKTKRTYEFCDNESRDKINRLSYYHVSVQSIETLIQGLEQLDRITRLFYEDFEDQDHNFKAFYRKMQDYLQRDILSQDLDDEFRSIVKRVLKRLDEVQDIEAKASFDCLRSTMSIYLKQESAPGRSAKWIVRGFNQIDGNVLQSNSSRQRNDPDRIYHFACLSNEDLTGSNKPEFTWPLNRDFFEVAQDPIDWKFQVYMNARREKHNFNRYALLYGLEFNRVKYRLSYVRHDQEKDKEMSYLLKMLGVRIVPYRKTVNRGYMNENDGIQIMATGTESYKPMDLYRFRVCRYKFLLESIIEGDTVYKDDFLLLKYMEILLENKVRTGIQNKPKMESILDYEITETFDELKGYFPFLVRMDGYDIRNKVKRRILQMNKGGKFGRLSESDRIYMDASEVFIHSYLTDKVTPDNMFKGVFGSVSDQEVEATLSDDALRQITFRETVRKWCDYCANREVCLARYEVVRDGE